VKFLFRLASTLLALSVLAGACDGTVVVSGYYRKDGTYVPGYTRRCPASSSKSVSRGGSSSTSGGSGCQVYGNYQTCGDHKVRDLNGNVVHDSNGHVRVHRSKAAKEEFMRERPCPSTGKIFGKCPGYVVDHVSPLACGGADAPFNMQWQTTAEGKAKDKWERRGCAN
jgi:hypothetical protein